MDNDELKSERVTLRLTESTRNFVESFGSENDNFSASFHKMMGLFHGKRAKKLRSDANTLENRILCLHQEEQNIYREVTLKMRDALKKIESVQKSVDQLHLAFEKNKK
ncbi:MAG: hypothetical protein FWD82_01195 [Defluviitaleaceae bacterium]|nr:hypothetical protein [Defluviitaleaceae bacterium]